MTYCCKLVDISCKPAKNYYPLNDWRPVSAQPWFRWCRNRWGREIFRNESLRDIQGIKGNPGAPLNRPRMKMLRMLWWPRMMPMSRADSVLFEAFPDVSNGHQSERLESHGIRQLQSLCFEAYHVQPTRQVLGLFHISRSSRQLHFYSKGNIGNVMWLSTRSSAL